MLDPYQVAIIYLSSNPSKILEIWDDPKSHWSGVLFRSLSQSGETEDGPNGEVFGDLCEIRSLEATGCDSKLTEEVMNDTRIPKIMASNNYLPKIEVEDLKIFAEWQNKIDKALNRLPPDISGSKDYNRE